MRGQALSICTGECQLVRSDRYSMVIKSLNDAILAGNGIIEIRNGAINKELNMGGTSSKPKDKKPEDANRKPKRK